MPLKGREVGIGVANCGADCFGELGSSAGRFEDAAQRSVSIRTRPPTDRKRETRPDFGADTLSGIEPAMGGPGKSIRSLLVVDCPPIREALSVIEPHVL